MAATCDRWSGRKGGLIGAEREGEREKGREGKGWGQKTAAETESKATSLGRPPGKRRGGEGCGVYHQFWDLGH